jgi:thioredoxin 1
MISSWCNPCKLLTPILAKAYEGQENHVKLVKMDVDENPETATTYNVKKKGSIR